MRPAEAKSCIDSSTFEFHKGNATGKSTQHRSKTLSSRPKLAPSKWDDAQKWLVGLSGVGDHNHNKSKPRNSNADDRRLLNSASQRERFSCSSADGIGIEDIGVALSLQDESVTKKIDCGVPVWSISRPMEDSALAVRSVCVRDMGTEMTPIASQEPSRTPTPLRATTPVLRSPISSRSSTPGKCRQGSQHTNSYQTSVENSERASEVVLNGKANGTGATDWPTRNTSEPENHKNFESPLPLQTSNPSALESRAMAWDEAERAKYMARYKREEVKIQAWENHEKRKAETEMRRMEVKADRLKSRAEEKMTNKLAAARRIAEEKRTNAEAKLNDQAARTSERADYIRRTGRLPSSFFSFKLPSLCGRKLCQSWSGH